MGPTRGAHVAGRRRLLALTAALLVVPGSDAVANPVSRIERAGQERFWSTERLRSARPLMPPTIGSARPALSGARRGAAPSETDFQSGPVADPTASPFRSVGKLYLTLRGKRRWCSATVVRSDSDSVLLTAAHCLYDGRRWSRRLLFVPAFDGHPATYGSWRGKSTVVPNPWFNSRNRNFDYGAVRLRPNSHGTVAHVVGELPVAWNQARDQLYHAVGYPGNRGGGDRMWMCSSLFGYTEPDLGAGMAPSAIGCDMRTGASGGPWLIQNPDGTVYLNSVTSFSIRDRRRTIFGPYLTPYVLTAIATADRR